MMHRFLLFLTLSFCSTHVACFGTSISNVYFKSSTTQTKLSGVIVGRFSLYDPTTIGQIIWEFQTGSSISSSPAIGNDGTIYIGSNDRKLYALNGLTGDKKWEFQTGNSIPSSPVIGNDGTIYIGSNDRKLYALNSLTGDKLWEFQTGGSIYSTPAIGDGGIVYIGSNDRRLYALNGLTGVKVWEFQSSGSITSPAIGGDGSIYIGSSDGNLYALHGTTGDKKWEYSLDNYLYSSAVVGPDGTIYIGTYRGDLHSLDANTGLPLWSKETGLNSLNSTTLGADGTIYITANGLHSFDALNGQKVLEKDIGSWIYSSPAIAEDGTIYFGSIHGKVYAMSSFNPESNYSWPMLGQNPQRTGQPSIDFHSVNYSLVVGDGDRDNDLFLIEGNMLLFRSNHSFRENPDYEIRVRAEDSLGNQFERGLQIRLLYDYLDRSTKDLLAAKLSEDPTDPVTNYQFVFWELLELVESNKFKTMLNTLGFSSDIFDLTIETVLEEGALEHVEFSLNQEFEIEEIPTYVAVEVLPTLDSLDARFATIDQNEIIQIYENSGYEEAIIVDYADSLVFRALTKIFTFLIRMELAYGKFDLSAREVLSMYYSGILTTEYIRDKYPDFGSVKDPSILLKANSDLKAAIDFYQEASPFLNTSSREQGLFIIKT